MKVDLNTTIVKKICFSTINKYFLKKIDQLNKNIFYFPAYQIHH